MFYSKITPALQAQFRTKIWLSVQFCQHSSLGNALVTLFQLFTLDHWYDILRDLMKVTNPIIVEIYIILWICIGAFIFRNIFAGIMGECPLKITRSYNLKECLFLQGSVLWVLFKTGLLDNLGFLLKQLFHLILCLLEIWHVMQLVGYPLFLISNSH